MSSAYGSGRASDTDFRQKWDKDEYAQRARDRENRERRRAENESRRKRGLPPLPSKDDQDKEPLKNLTHREDDEKLKVDAIVGKTQVVQADAREAGFFCKECNKVFKDNISWLEHINGRKHQMAVGKSMVVERSSLQDVKERLEMLKQKRDQSNTQEYDLAARVAELKQKDEEERLKRRERRRLKKKGGLPEEVTEMDTEENDMSRLMGFSGFGSSKA